MRQQADVKCYHCGHVCGTWLWPTHASPAGGLFRSASSGQLNFVLMGQLRCLRCQGPTYFENPQPIREQQPRLVTWRGRGRPPKNAIRIELPPEAGAKRRRPVVLYGLMVDGRA